MITEELLAAFEEGKTNAEETSFGTCNIWRLMKVCQEEFILVSTVGCHDGS